jgi:hypothetical protein
MRSKCTICCQQGNGKAESHEWRPPPLRPHQERALEGLRRSYSAGRRRPMDQLPTDAGKTRLAAEIKQNCLLLDHAGNHLRFGMVTDIGQSRLDDGKERKNAGGRKREKASPCPSSARNARPSFRQELHRVRNAGTGFAPSPPSGPWMANSSDSARTPLEDGPRTSRRRPRSLASFFGSRGSADAGTAGGRINTQSLACGPTTRACATPPHDRPLWQP